MDIYTVKAGDSIWKIAKAYGVSPERIITDNAIANPEQLVIGQALLILSPKVVHKVRAGETLADIAQQYQTTALTLVQNNPTLINDPTLNPGRILTISFTDRKIRTISVNGYAYPDIRRNILVHALPYLTTLSIFSYGFTTEGALIPIEDEPLIELAQQFSVAPIMVLSSITEKGTFEGSHANKLFRDEQMQNTLFPRIIETMQKKGYYGLDVDFEYIAAEDREAYLQFLRNIADVLHENGFFLHVDLAPKISASQPGTLYEGHDYQQIGRIADTVLLMTYEWGYTYGPPMAIAPLDKVQEVVQYAVSEIPRSKILLGIPNYAYDWTLPFVKGVSSAKGMGNEAAVLLAANNNASIDFDTVAQSPHFTYWDSKWLEHVVWFEDVRSIRAKLELMTNYQLAGVSYWNVMQPFTQNWLLVNALYQIRKL